MLVYAITYTLNAPGQKYSALHAYIKGHAQWAQVGTSSFLVVSGKTVAAVSNDVQAILDSNDHHYVFVVSGPHAGFGPKLVNDWLATHL